jgi:hypothetical protein
MANWLVKLTDTLSPDVIDQTDRFFRETRQTLEDWLRDNGHDPSWVHSMLDNRGMLGVYNTLAGSGMTIWEFWPVFTDDELTDLEDTLVSTLTHRFNQLRIAICDAAFHVSVSADPAEDQAA